METSGSVLSTGLCNRLPCAYASRLNATSRKGWLIGKMAGKVHSVLVSVLRGNGVIQPRMSRWADANTPILHVHSTDAFPTSSELVHRSKKASLSPIWAHGGGYVDCHTSRRPAIAWQLAAFCSTSQSHRHPPKAVLTLPDCAGGPAAAVYQQDHAGQSLESRRESCQGWGSVAGMTAECTEVVALPRDRTKGEGPRCACCCMGTPPNSLRGLDRQ